MKPKQETIIKHFCRLTRELDRFPDCKTKNQRRFGLHLFVFDPPLIKTTKIQILDKYHWRVG